MEKREVSRMILTIMLVGIAVAIASAFAAGRQSNSAKFCQHANFGGQCFTVSKGGGNTDLSKKSFPGGGNWNDKISSIQAGSNVRVKAYENLNWTGECIVFSGSSVGGTSGGKYTNLSDYDMYNGKSWNDQITSFQVGGSELKCQ